MPPEVIEALEAIDATLAGEAVDPRHAELAELALLLRAERPEAPLSFSAEMDQRVRERFAPRPGGTARTRRRWRGWLFAPAAGLAAAVGVAIVIVASQGPSPGDHPPANAALSSAPVRAGAAAPVRAGVPAPVRAGAGVAAVSSAPPAVSPAGALAIRAPHAAATTAFSAASVASVQGAVLAPSPNGRRIEQGGQLQLSTAPSRVETVAEEVFQVAGRENAIVQSSNVTATQGPGGYAQFQLSIPSASLAPAMAALSTLPYASVSSRTDTTQDVNNQYLSDVRALADARLLRTALLKALANATTQAAIVSVTARLHDANASISSDEATLRGLTHQIDFSQVTVTVNAGAVPVVVKHGGGFTLSKAAHDAGRVLTVAAGVALICAAALVPIGLLVALGWWARARLIRRRREHALDLI